MVPTSFLVPCPPNHEDPINKSEENARLKVHKPAPPGEIWPVEVASWISSWRSINLAVPWLSIITVAGFVCEGDKQRRHSFFRCLSSLATKGRAIGTI